MMRRKILTIGSTAIYLHVGTLLFAAYMMLLGQADVLLTGMVSILLHECAHAAAAAVMGHPPAEMELTPLGALMRLDDEMALPWFKRLVMLSAGPVMSFALCLAALMATRSGLMTQEIGRMIFQCNLMLTLFNLMPALPLDGGRVLALLVGLKCKQETVKRIMVSLGTLLGLALIGGNLALSLRMGGWNLSMTMAGCFLMYAAAVGTTSSALSELRMLMDRKIRLESRGALSCKWFTVLTSLPLRKAIQLMPPGCCAMFQVVEPGTMRRLAQVSEDRLVALYLHEPGGLCDLLCKEEP